MGDALLAQRASFKSMWGSTKQDWDIITTHYQPFARELPDRVLAHLKLLGGDSGPAMECLPVEAFEPMVRRVFLSPKNSTYRNTREI